MSKPVRLRLSRKRGFNLQAASMALNGLDAVNCARPGKWGNPFKIGDRINLATGHTRKEPLSREEVVLLHRRRTCASAEMVAAIVLELRGKNLACHCGPNDLCHVDTLLGIANA